MIEFIFSTLLVPLWPELTDPGVRHDLALKALQARLSQAQIASVAAVGTPQLSADLQLKPHPELPPISGRVFDWSLGRSDPNGAQVAGGNVSAGSLRLTGLIETAGQFVGIVNDGEKDHVVGVGSYVMDAYRVVSLGKRRMVLMPIDGEAGNSPLELGLLPGDASRGFQ